MCHLAWGQETSHTKWKARSWKFTRGEDPQPRDSWGATLLSLQVWGIAPSYLCALDKEVCREGEGSVGLFLTASAACSWYFGEMIWWVLLLWYSGLYCPGNFIEDLDSVAEDQGITFRSVSERWLLLTSQNIISLCSLLTNLHHLLRACKRVVSQTNTWLSPCCPLISPKGLIQMNSLLRMPQEVPVFSGTKPQAFYWAWPALIHLFHAPPRPHSPDYTLHWSHGPLSSCFRIKIFLERSDTASSEVAFAQHSRKRQSHEDISVVEYLPDRLQVLGFIFRTLGSGGESGFEKQMNSILTPFSLGFLIH